MTQDNDTAPPSRRAAAQLERAERMKRIEQAYLAAQVDAGIPSGKLFPFRILPPHERKLLERFAVRIEESLEGAGE